MNFNFNFGRTIKSPQKIADENPVLRWQTHFADSDDLCRYVAEKSDGQCLLSFSLGKDSIGSWIQLKRFFTKIELVYLYLVPDLEFVNQSIEYYETLFNQKIMRLPHPSLYRWLNNATFQAPENLRTIENCRLPMFDYDDSFKAAGEDLKLPKNVFTAVGVRSADSLNRHTSLKMYGSLNRKRKVFYPVYDWKKARLLQEITDSKIKLPVDYKLFGRSFDGIDYRFLKPIKENFPRDYERILTFFPLAELEVKKYEFLQTA